MKAWVPIAARKPQNNRFIYVCDKNQTLVTVCFTGLAENKANPEDYNKLVDFFISTQKHEKD